ncbi:PucR family transcriptional regulator [Tomitella biformata]|uniref:PucR family transcriptional regulator n=1 Tax=Tomitella biformata TaxID=630403 RepID=UPI00046473C2|nr:PucR family transcriptional regulator [Tomitella biformata]
MEGIAENERPDGQELTTPTSYPLAVRELLALPSLAGSKLIAGDGGLERVVRRVNVIEVPDILPWVQANELLLTTGFPLRHGESGQPFDADALVALVEGLDERGAAALGVKEGRYLDDLPAAMLDAADRLGFPLFRMPRETGFNEVLTEVFTHLVDRQAGALDVADRMHRALTAIVLEGGDLPQIAEEVATVFEAAVLVCSPDGRVQARSGPEADLRTLDQSSIFDASGRLRTERLRHGLQAAPDDVPGQIAVAQVAAGEVDYGLIVAYASDLGPVTVQSLERAATVVALAVTKQRAVAAVESKFRGDFLRDVLNGTAGTPEQVLTHCVHLEWDMSQPMAVVVAQLDPAPEAPDPATEPVAARMAQERFSSAWEQVARRRHRTAPVVGFTHEVVLLLPVALDPTAPEQISPQHVAAAVAELQDAVAGDRGGGRHSFSTGVSRIVESVAELPQAYDQARRAVQVGRRMSGNGTVAHFDGLGVHRLLSLIPEGSELQAFAGEVLGAMAADTEESVDLRQTLQQLLDTNCNVAETARALHFHYNTLRYRIAKLETIVGPFTTDPVLRLDVALALRVMEMRGL